MRFVSHNINSHTWTDDWKPFVFSDDVFRYLWEGQLVFDGEGLCHSTILLRL